MRFLMEGKQFSCRHVSQLDCQSSEGNNILLVFGFDELHPYSTFFVLFGLVTLSLSGAVLSLEVAVLRKKGLRGKQILEKFRAAIKFPTFRNR